MKQKLLDQLDFWSQMELDQGVMRGLVLYLVLTCTEMPI